MMKMLEGTVKDNLPSLNDVKKCTTIKIDGLAVNSMANNMKDKLLEKFEFIPPIFEEYVIKTDNLSDIKQMIESEFCNAKMSDQQKTKVIAKQLARLKKQFKNFDDLRYQYTFVKWQTETSFTLLHFDAGRKRLYISVQYVYDEYGNMTFDGYTDVLSKSWIDSYTQEEINAISSSIIILVLSVSDYLLNYTDKVQYILDNDNQPFKKTKKSPTVSDSSDNNKESNQEQESIQANESNNQPVKKKYVPKTDRRNIYYKSSIKIYEVSAEEIVNYKKKKYNKIKQSWFVRGYYQRFGKEKIPQYVPPRINHRRGVTTPPTIGNMYKVDVPILDNADNKKES